MSRLYALVVIAACDSGAKPVPPPPPAPIIVAKAPVPISQPQSVAPVPHDPHAHVFLASIKRGMCLGWCPSYTFTVYRDGVVEYDGDSYVKRKGKATGRLSDAQLAAIDKLFTDANYAAYKDSYEHYDATDAPSSQTGYAPLDGKSKFVRHYHGDMHAPESLSLLETKFDEIVKIDKWIGTEAEREKLAGR